MLRSIICLALPSVATQCLRVGALQFTLMVAGRTVSSTEFAAISLGMSLVNACVVSAGMGVASVLDTIATQEFGRDPQSAFLGLALRRALIATTIIAGIPLVLLTLFRRELLGIAFHSDLVEPTSTYLAFTWPGTLALVYQSCLQKYVNAQGIVNLPLMGNAVSIVTLLVLLPVVHALHGGVAEFALVVSAGRLAAFVSLAFLASRTQAARRRWGTWQMRDVISPNDEGFRLFASLTGQSVMSSIFERFGFEMMSFLCASVNTRTLHVYTLVFNAWILLFSPAAGLYVAGSTLVGNAVGRRDAATAESAAVASFGVSLVCATVVAGCFGLWPSVVTTLYTGDVAVVEAANFVAPIVALSLFCDITSYGSQGTLRATNRVAVVTLGMFVSQWLVAVPVAVTFLFAVPYGALGACFAASCGMSFIFLLYCVSLARIEWSEVISTPMPEEDRAGLSVAEDAEDVDDCNEPSESTTVDFHRAAGKTSEGDTEMAPLCFIPLGRSS